VVDADDALGDPRTDELADDHLKPYDISSVLNAPVRVVGTVVGIVCHEHVGEPRLWQADEIKFAGEVADQAAHAMTSAQRKRSERRLQMSEERFRSIVNCSPMGLLMYRLNEDGQLLFSGSNPAADAILGVDLQDSIGKTLEEVFPPLADTEVPDHYRRVASDGTPWHIEQIEYEDELIRGAYEVHAFQTAPDMVTVMFLDITDRKRAEEALRENEERYRLLFERNLAAVYRSTLDGRIIECNDAFAAIFGCSSRSDALSRHAQAFYPSSAARSDLVNRLRKEGELKNHEMVMRRTDGEPVWIIANMSLVNHESGEQKIIEGTMVNVTDRKQADDRLVLQSSALEAAANAIVISDAGGTIEWVNKAFTRLTGYSAAEAIGESLWILKSGREEGSLYEEPWKAVAAGQVWRGELVNRRKDGRLYTEEMTITPVRGSDGEISQLVAVQQDVSERKRMEEQLLQAQKMEAVGRLAGGVAHDFNNLLQAMLGVTELLRQPEMRSDDSAEKLQELEELVQRGSQLTRQLLLFSRRDTARQEELDLNELVKGTVKLLTRLLRENIELVFEPSSGGLPLMADRGQIEQVVMNLAVNACDAMPQGGKLSLVTGLDAGSAWLEVSDTGEGIPEDIRDQLFEPFFTTKARGKGTGLGLSVVHGIVNRLGGRIDLDSHVGQGTSIRVTFPAITATGHTVHRAAPGEQLADGGGERVLVVEDDPAVRDSLKEILGVLGYQVTTVGSREELDRLPDDSEYDLLLSDYVLPDGSGTEIADELREKWPTIGVIVMSGYAQDSGVGREVAMGNLHFLQKPFSAQTLSEAVRNALANGAAVADEVVVE
jgi:PAS domain S-box-containing protein